MISISQKKENKYPFIFNFGHIEILRVLTIVFEINSNIKKLKQIMRKKSNPASVFFGQKFWENKIGVEWDVNRELENVKCKRTK